MRNEETCAPVLDDVLQALDAAVLEQLVADGKDFVHDENFRIETTRGSFVCVVEQISVPISVFY